MNTAILQKCLEELKKEAPRKDYVIGMLETLVELGGTSLIPVSLPAMSVGNTISNHLDHVDETETIPAHLKPGPLGRIS